MISLAWRQLEVNGHVNTCLPSRQSLNQHMVADYEAFSCAPPETYSRQQHFMPRIYVRMEETIHVNMYCMLCIYEARRTIIKAGKGSDMLSG